VFLQEHFAAVAPLEVGTVRTNRAADEDLLNSISAIRAAAEILEDNRDLPAGEQRAFFCIIRSEAGRLAAAVRSKA